MVAVRSQDADRLLAKLPSHIFACLIFGTDVGLVSERARKIVRDSVPDMQDPFQLVRLDGDDLAGDPLRLADEVNTVGLFGGQRAIWIEAGSKNFAAAVEPLFQDPPADCRLIVEAGALKKDAPLRKIFEREKAALAIECYPDRPEDIARLIEAEAAAAHLTIDDDTKALLVSLLGADRLTTRSELAKLMLFARGKDRVTEDDVAAIVADASALHLDAAINGAFSGDYAAVSDTAGKVFAGGGDANALLGAALWHAIMLHKIKVETEKGGNVDVAVDRSSRGAGFARKAQIKAQLRTWSSVKLARAVEQIADAVRRCRRQADLGEEIAVRALWSVALAARGRS